MFILMFSQTNLYIIADNIHVLYFSKSYKSFFWQANGKAPTRAYHSATLYRHELWIFGGVFPQPMSQPDGCSNEIHVFSPLEEGWYSPIVMGEKPTPRSGYELLYHNYETTYELLYHNYETTFLQYEDLSWASSNYVRFLLYLERYLYICKFLAFTEIF
jgi:hypothetical protein